MEYEDYLKHYGVKGMKWGKRKPKELSERKAKKVAKLDQKVADSKAEIVSLRKQRKNSNIVKKVGINRQIKKSVEQQQRDQFDSNAIKNGKLTTNQRTAVKAAIGIGLIAGPEIAYRANESMRYAAANKRQRDKGRAAASKLADTRGINSYRTIDLKVGADGEWR